MNKAFTKETDVKPTSPPEERSVSSAIDLVTPRGAQLITEQITSIEKKQAAEVDSFTKSVLRRDLLARQSSMQIVARNTVYNTVSFGSRAPRGTAEITIAIVGVDESDPKGELIGWTAP